MLSGSGGAGFLGVITGLAGRVLALTLWPVPVPLKGFCAWAAGLSLLAVLGGAGVGALLRVKTPARLRTLYFWWNVGPIMFRYWLAKRLSRSDTDREARYKKLHKIYAPVAGRLVGELRGMFAKVAQVAGVVGSMVPEEYALEFRKLQDRAPAASWLDISRVLSEDLHAPPERVFEAVCREPLGAASLGQAHLVTWRGREVVVKVQYPDSKANLRADFDSLQRFVGMTKPQELPMIQKLRKQAEGEVDYTAEAEHLRVLHEAIAASPEFRGAVAVPAPIPELTQNRVLGMEYLPGHRLDDVLKDRLRELGMEPTTNYKNLLQHVGRAARWLEDGCRDLAS